MLGEKLGQSTGRLTGMRVLPTEGDQIYIEVTLQGRGTLLGREITDIGTYRQTVRSGALYGEGRVLLLGDNGDVADFLGGGVGKQLGAGFKASYGVYGAFERATGAFARLPLTANVTEYEIEEDGSYHWELFEWIGARAAAAIGWGSGAR